MKTLQISMFISFLFMSLFAVAQTSKKETIKVWGNCSMCKKTIETAAKKSGAAAASWNEETMMMDLVYNPSKTSNAKIQKAIAAAGYDTQDVTAADAAYNNLHACCQYDRKAAAETVKANCCSKDAAGKMICTDEKCTASCCTKTADGKKVCNMTGAAQGNHHACCQNDSKTGAEALNANCCSKDAAGIMICTNEKCTASCCAKTADGKKVCTDEGACKKTGCCSK